MAATELCASELEAEVSHLKAKLKESRVRIWMLDDELLTLSQDVEAIRTTF